MDRYHARTISLRVGGACPSVHISEDGKTLRITGKHVPVNPETLYLVEVTLDISADLVREALLNQ